MFVSTSWFPMFIFQVYNVSITRKQLPWPIELKDGSLARKFECPMTLTVLYNPISIAGSDPKVTMSQPCMDMLTRRCACCLVCSKFMFTYK